MEYPRRTAKLLVMAIIPILLLSVMVFGAQAKASAGSTATHSRLINRTTLQVDQMSETVPPPAIGDIRYIPCPMNLPEGEVDGETVLCGQVIVPENWEEADGQAVGGENTLGITFAIFKAKSSALFAEPIIYLEGGPGGSALEDIETLSAYFSKLRETRDFIYYDQRGTAYSSNLECPSAIQAKPIADALEASEEVEGAAVDEGEDAGTDDADEQTVETETPAESEPFPTPVPYLDQDPQEVLEAQRNVDSPSETGCSEYFQEQGVDLSQYTTANSIRDLTTLMQALDYDVYNVYGISYGSRLGLELLRTYEKAGDSDDLPEIRSVVIDGIDPPHIDIITQSPFAPMDITLRMLSDCEAEEACGAAYPDIRQRAVNLLAQTEETPLTITSSEGMTETVTLEALTALFSGKALTDGEELNPIGYVEVVPYLPVLVDELDNGVGDTYMGLKQGLLPPEAVVDVENASTLFDPLALRTQQLSAEAEMLSQELAMLSEQAQRSSDALGGDDQLPDFFARELVQLASEQASFESLGVLSKLFFQIFATQEPNRETLAGIIEFLELDDLGQATLNGVVNLMNDDEVAETIALVMSDRVIEQLVLAVQGQMNTVVLCNDMYGQFDVDSAFEAYRNAEAPQLLSDPGMLITYMTRCERYKLTAGAGESFEPVISNLPILVANGSIDATTPAEWGESAAEYLPNAQLVTIPMYDHGATAKSECGQDIVRYFFTYPEQEVNDDCIESIKPVFILPDENQNTPEVSQGAELNQSNTTEMESTVASEQSNLNISAHRGGVYDRGANSHATGAFAPPNYHVARGDTLFSIGNRFGITPRQIARSNGLSSNNIYAGQTLIIPGAQGGGSGRPPTAAHYERVNFAPGATDWSGTGVIRNGHPKGYIISAMRGQSLEINTQSHGEPLQVILERANGKRVRLNGENNGISNHLFTTLPATGDYIVIVKSTTAPESPGLQFGITFVVL